MAAIVPADVLLGLQKYGLELMEKIVIAGKRNDLGFDKAMNLANEAKGYARKNA